MGSPRARSVLLSLAFASMLPAEVLGQKVPVGPEFQVTAATTYGVGRYGPGVAVDDSGNFIVSWAGNGYDQLRIYDATGTPRGPSFQIGQAQQGEYTLPASLGTDASGNFVVAWENDDCALAVNPGYLCARRFDGAGSPLTPELEVTTSQYGYLSKVASDAAGNFVVVWSDYDNPSGEHPIIGRRFDSAGSPLGAEFQVNSYTTSCCAYSITTQARSAFDVTSDATGNFAVVWSRAAYDIVARFFDSGGSPRGPDFTVSTNGYYSDVDIAADGAGRFIVVWEEDYAGIHAARFDSAGTRVGGNFQVSAAPDPSQAKPSVAAGGAGNFVVVWGQGYENPYIAGRQFDSSGTPLTPNFQINTTPLPSYYPAFADVSSGANGNFVVVWEWQGANYEYVLGQRFGGFGAGGCTVGPMPSCRSGTQARKGVLLIKDKDRDLRDRVSWKWRKGEEPLLSGFGDPLADTSFAICIYDASAETQPVFGAAAPAGGDCPGRPCWKVQPGRKFEYKDRAHDPDGIESLVLRAGERGKAQIKMRGKGENLGMPGRALTPPVIVQAQSSDGKCWEATYSQFILKNDDATFRARADGPNCGSSAPACDGVCPGGETCVDTGGACACQPASPSGAFLDLGGPALLD